MKQHSSFEIQINPEIDPLALRRLYEVAGWWDDRDENRPDTDWLRQLAAGSLCFAAAFADGHMIAMGRAISDGVSDAYIQDVIVDPGWRRRGVGAALVTRIVRFLRDRHVDWIGLIAEPGSEAFYAELGFKVMTDHTPMRLPG